MKAALQPSPGDVRAELNAICGHKRFVRSDRACELLRFIVDQKLAGNNLNEQIIGVKIFGRSAGFDSGNDTIVRTQAVLLRRRLEDYYQDNPDARVRILIPRGGYNPTFNWINSVNRSESASELAVLPEIFPAASQNAPEQDYAPSEPIAPLRHWHSPLRRNFHFLLVTSLLVAAIAAGLFFWWPRQSAHLAGNHMVVLAEFVNTTGEPIFDGVLKQALAIQLEQTPFVNVLSDSKIGATLKLMNRPTGERLTQQVAREICERTNSSAAIDASIASMGTIYLIALRAVNCQNGETLASTEVTANNRERVLSGLRTGAIQLRQKLGESLASIQKFNKPLDAVTTSSLEALKVYSEGMRLEKESGWIEIPYFQRATELDSNFAQAYLALGINYWNSGEVHVAGSNLRKAFELRDRVTEHERLVIMAIYYLAVTGELQKSVDISRQWARTYPQDATAHLDLSAEYQMMGDYEQCADEGEKAIRIDPDNFSEYGNTIGCSYAADRRDEAKEVIQRSRARGLDASAGFSAYLLAFLDGDEPEMRREIEAARGKRWIEDAVFSAASDTEAYHGRVQKARELSAEAVDSAERNSAKEAAALWKVNPALREAELGDAARASQYAKAAMATGSGRHVAVLAALAFARANQPAPAEKILARLDAQFPLDSLLQHYWFPTARAAIQLDRRNAQGAIDALEGKTAYELGIPAQFSVGPMYPVYIRGLAFLKAEQPQKAAEQFRKIIEHPGVIVNFPLASLAHLQLARALAMCSDITAARREYQTFFALWKDADPDIPILKSAKLECAKLH